MRTIRIGSGAGFSNDRVEPGIELLEKGQLDYFCLECLAERTIAIAQKEKNLDPNIGYNPYLAYRMKKILPIAAEKHVKVITNMGGANVQKAVEKTAEIARSAGISGLKIVGVLGDDIFDRLDRYADYPIFETGERLGDLKNKVAANAYLGCAGIVQALKDGADIVITGRCSDPALFLGPLVYEFNWPMDNYDLMGKGTVVGHLLECSGQVSGGNFCVPGYKDVEDLWHLGFPYADVSEDGTIEISKLEGTGGRVDVQTCSEQLIYEIHDPSSYYTPDCVADFSQVAFEQVGKDRVRVTGATGRPRTDTLKVSVGYKDVPQKVRIGRSAVPPDRAYGARTIREYISAHRASYVIPPQSNVSDPWPVDWHLYKERHLVKCFSQKIKWFRRIATRYDKPDASLLAFVYFAAIAILLL